jgi:hypothetical protein
MQRRWTKVAIEELSNTSWCLDVSTTYFAPACTRKHESQEERNHGKPSYLSKELGPLLGVPQLGGERAGEVRVAEARGIVGGHELLKLLLIMQAENDYQSTFKESKKCSQQDCLPLATRTYEYA